MKDLSDRYPGREYRERWVVGLDNLPILVQAFECQDGWESAFCPEAGFSCGYDYTYDTEEHAWDEALQRAHKKREAALAEYDRWKAAYSEHLKA